MALNISPLPRPDYLIGVTTENALDNRTKGALNIFKSGRLSKAPCSLCVEHNADCIVASTVAGSKLGAPKLYHIPLYRITIHRNGKPTLQSSLLDLTIVINRDIGDNCEPVSQPIQPRPVVTKNDNAPPKKPRGEPKQVPTLPRHDVPRPEYLQGVTLENYGDLPTKWALNIYLHGKLSPKPCRRCVEANAVCIVANTRATRCMRCAYNDVLTVECLAGGASKIEIEHFEISPDTGYPIIYSAPDETNTEKCKTKMAPLNGQAASQPAITFASAPVASGASDPQDQAKHPIPTKQKRKRGAADPLDASELPTNRPRQFRAAALTGKPFAPAAPCATSNPSSPIFEHPYAPTAPKATTPTSDPTDAGNDMAHDPIVRYAPPKSNIYDLDIQKTDPAKWAQWAYDLHKELYGLRYVQDLGPYTHGVIKMMKEDGVWPTEDVVEE